jgi:hypothetical protein
MTVGCNYPTTRNIVADAPREKLPVPLVESEVKISYTRQPGVRPLAIRLKHSTQVTRTAFAASIVSSWPAMRNDSFLLGAEQSNPLSPELAQELQERLSEAVIKCSERCLYQSAKW